MQEITQLTNSKSFNTFLCRNCSYCIVNGDMRECEWDCFPPSNIKKSLLYTPIEFDCVYFMER